MTMQPLSEAQGTLESSTRISLAWTSTQVVGQRLKTIDEFQEDGLPLSPAIWFRLQAALIYAKNTLRKFDNSNNITETVLQFITKIKKGSKSFRRILTCKLFFRVNPCSSPGPGEPGGLPWTLEPLLSH